MTRIASRRSAKLQRFQSLNRSCHIEVSQVCLRLAAWRRCRRKHDAAFSLTSTFSLAQELHSDREYSRPLRMRHTSFAVELVVRSGKGRSEIGPYTVLLLRADPRSAPYDLSVAFAATPEPRHFTDENVVGCGIVLASSFSVSARLASGPGMSRHRRGRGRLYRFGQVHLFFRCNEAVNAISTDGTPSGTLNRVETKPSQGDRPRQVG